MPVQKSYTRITLALDIIRKIKSGRYRGYHELNSVKHRINLFDIISIEPSKETGISCNNPEVPAGSGNLCWQAVERVQKQFGIKEKVHITIEKNIPVKGGLAGGSANAATVISMLNRLWGLELNRELLASIGRDIGMDVPFYFTGGTAFDTETTGCIEPVETNLVIHFVLVIPGFGVSTRTAYNRIDYNETGREKSKTARMKAAFAMNDMDGVIGALHNDFEESIFTLYPLLKKIKETLLQQGCPNAVMSGSGSTIIGIARDENHAGWVKERLRRDYAVIQACSYYP
jgi:4-diphosphocytidyl-2-C-methyl-D-erythritol kinase